MGESGGWTDKKHLLYIHKGRKKKEKINETLHLIFPFSFPSISPLVWQISNVFINGKAIKLLPQHPPLYHGPGSCISVTRQQRALVFQLATRWTLSFVFAYECVLSNTLLALHYKSPFIVYLMVLQLKKPPCSGMVFITLRAGLRACSY